MFGPREKLDAYSTYLIFEGAYAVCFATIATVNLVYQVEIARLNPLQLVLVGTVLELTSFVCQVPTGALADLYSRRMAIVLGTFLVGAGFILEGSIPRFTTILLAQVIWGVGITFVTGAEEAWIAGEVGDERIGQVFLRGTQVGQLGALLGAAISVALASIRLNLPIVVGGALIAALAGFLLLAMPERNFRRTAPSDRTSWHAIGDTIGRSSRLVRYSPLLLTILALQVFFGMSSEGFDRLSAAHFLHDLTLPGLGPFQPVVWFGVMTVGQTLLAIGSTEIVRRRLDMSRHGAVVRTLFTCEALQVASMVVFGLAVSFPLALAAFWGASVLRQTSGPIYMAWLTQRTEPSVRATVISMSGLTNAFGQIAGGPLIGAIGTFASLRAALVAAGVALSPALPLYARAAGQGKSAPAPVAEAVQRPEP